MKIGSSPETQKEEEAAQVTRRFGEKEASAEQKSFELQAISDGLR